MAHPHIVNFINNLSENEIQIAEEHLKKSTSFSSRLQKILKLFELLIANKDKQIPDNKLCNELNCSTGALRVLKSRLLEKVLEAFTFDKHIYNTNIFSEYDIMTFKLRKKLLILKILSRSLNQGKTEILYEILNQIIDTAKEYEAYAALIEALTTKKYLKGIRAGINEFDKLNEQIIFYDTCQKAVNYAADCYYRLILNNDFVESLSQKELDNHFQNFIQQMEIDYKKTKSQQVDYYLNIIRFAFCEREKNYSEAIKYCDKLIFIIKKSKVIYRKERIGMILDNLSQIKTYIGNYKAAAIDARKAQQYYIQNSFNYFSSKQQEFYSNLYNGNMRETLKCIDKLLEQPLIDTGEFRKSKYIYYKSCVLFASGKYKEALDLLKMSLEIEKDKTRWNISLRILNIMIFIELQKINEADSALESLRKHIERQNKEEEVKPRDALIVKTLRELEKDNFNYERKNVKVDVMLKKLSEKDTPVAWEHYSTELVPFHKWLEGKKKL